MKSRVNTHIIETRSKDHIRKVINSTGMALFRDITERDYGIDAIIELFDDGSPTGKIALVQIKGTEKNIVPLKRSNAISCRISSSNACYATQIHIPVILLYICISKPLHFYYVRLQDVLTAEHIRKIKHQQTINVNIPVANTTAEDIEPLLLMIREYYT